MVGDWVSLALFYSLSPNNSCDLDSSGSKDSNDVMINDSESDDEPDYGMTLD